MDVQLGSYHKGDINIDSFDISERKFNSNIFQEEDFHPSINQDDPFVETIYWEDNLMPLKVNNDYQDFDLVPEFQKQCDSLTMQSFYECQQQKIY